MQRALDFDKTPTLGVPLPFFLNVPCFALLAGLLAVWAGPQAFASRWSPAALALTHLWTLGVLGSAMLGALVQILAVACNVPVPHARAIAATVHAFYTAGTLALVASFLHLPTGARIPALGLLGVAFATYLTAVGWALWQHRAQVYPGAREILVPVRCALAALALTVVIGIGMGASLTLPRTPTGWVGSHVLWGLAGWGGLLLMGMSFQLLPIFQATELYPRRLVRWLPPAICTLLLAWTLCAAGAAPVLQTVTGWLLITAYAAWCAATLHLLWTRKRPQREPTTLFWYASMASLAGCVVLWPAWTFGHAPRMAFALGVLMILGVLGSAVNGMLYKILPFLLWKHAQDAMPAPSGNPALLRHYVRQLPRTADYIPQRPATIQWALHVTTLVAWTLAGLGLESAAQVAGSALLLSASSLAWNLLRALRLYHRVLRVLASLPHSQEAPG